MKDAEYESDRICFMSLLTLLNTHICCLYRSVMQLTCLCGDTHLMSAFGRWREVDHWFEVILSYIVRLTKANLGYCMKHCLQKKKKKIPLVQQSTDTGRRTHKPRTRSLWHSEFRKIIKYMYHIVYQMAFVRTFHNKIC